MSNYCNKHSSLSPIRYKTGNKSIPNTDSNFKQNSNAPADPAKINIQIDYTTQFNNNNNSQQRQLYTPNNQRGQQTESTHAGISPLLQQKLQEFQVSTPFQLQNYVSNEGIPLRPQQIDQMKLRQEIAAREHELKLLAQMDYLLDLIKNLDQDRNVNIDQQKIEEIERLKSDYQSINDEIQNLSFSQNLQHDNHDNKELRASRQNHQYESTTPLGYSSIGGGNNQNNNNPILAELDDENNNNNYQSQNQQNLTNSNKMQQSVKSQQSQRSNNQLHQSVKSNQSQQKQQLLSSQQQQQSLNPNQENNNYQQSSILASNISQQEQLFQMKMDNTLQEQDETLNDQDNQNYESNNMKEQSQKLQQQSMKSSIHSYQSRKSNLNKDQLTQDQQQQVANVLLQSIPISQTGGVNNNNNNNEQQQDQLYNSNNIQMINSQNQSRFSSVKQQQPQNEAYYYSGNQNQQQPENYQSLPIKEAIQNTGVNLTGSYSLKNSQRSQPNTNNNIANSQKLQQYMSPAKKLEQSIQTSLQLLQNSQKNINNNNDSVDKNNIFEQQLQMYEKQIKELIDENECLKKNIADSQFYKKILVDSKEQTSFITGNSRGSNASFTQPIVQAITEQNGLQEIQEALKEKESDLQILIQNITLEKDQNKALIEENELLKVRLSLLEREALEMQEQRLNQQQNHDIQQAYSSVEGSNYDSKHNDPDQDNLIRRMSKEQEEIVKENENMSRRLSELESEQSKRSIHYQEEINRYQKQITDLKEELGQQHAQHVEYIGRFNQHKINQLTRQYEEKLETEQIKNMLSADMQDTLGHTVGEQEIEIQKLKNDLLESNQDLMKVKQNLNNINEELQKEQENNKIIQEQFQNEQDQNRIIQEEKQQLLNKLQDQENQINYLQNEIQSIQQTYIEIELKKENLILQNNQLNQRMEELEDIRNQELQEKEEAIKHITELQQLLEDKHQQIDNLTQEKDSIKAEYDELLKTLNDMELNLQAIQINFNNNKNQHLQLKLDTQELKQDIINVQNAELDDIEIRQSIQDLKKELNIQDDDNNEDAIQNQQEQIQSSQNFKNDLHYSHSSKHSHHHSSSHNSARFMKNSVQSQNNNNNQDQDIGQQDQNEQIYMQDQDYNNNNEQDEYDQNEIDDCANCDMCMVEELTRQNEQLKEQLLIKEKEIIELKTNPLYYAKIQQQVNSLAKSPFNNISGGGKSSYYVEINDQAINNRNVYESPMAKQQINNNNNNNNNPNPFTSPNSILKKYPQELSAKMSISNSKNPEQMSSSSYKQQQQHSSLPQQQQMNNSGQQQYQSYSVLQSEIEHLQKIFDQKCKEVDSWKKTYQQFYDN